MWLTVGRAPAAYSHWQIKKTGKLPMRNDIAGSSPFALTSRPGPENYSKNHSNSDDELIAKIAAGNRLAMQVLYARHHTRVYRFLLRLVGNDATAEDLTSDAFLSVWRQAHRFEGRSAVTTWLLAIARYKALAELRRRPAALSEEENADVADAADDPEVALQAKHRGEILRRCLGQLSREHREIIDLVYYHEKSVQEVAGIVGIPGNTVKTRMFYARRRLSELLATHGIVEAAS
jgi:RNA polymerase sigma-70 factor (ECF subfamily)